VKIFVAGASMEGRAFRFSRWTASMLGFACGSLPAYGNPERKLQDRRLDVNAVNTSDPAPRSKLGFACGSPPAYEGAERRIQDRRLAVNEREPQRSSVARRAGRSPFGLMLTRGYFR
jgi:allophanate hydrolase subunit 1